MGILASLLSSGQGRTDDPDPVSGLTSRDKYLLTSSWAVVRKNPTQNGVALLLLYFEKYPDTINLFPFRDIPLDKLKNNKRFHAHCNSVVYALNNIVDSLDNTDLLVEILSKVGETHFKRNVTEQNFIDLKVTTIELFSTFMKPDEIAAWKKALEVVFSVMIKGLESESQKASS